jgi:hypothetical protein
MRTPRKPMTAKERAQGMIALSKRRPDMRPEVDYDEIATVPEGAQSAAEITREIVSLIREVPMSDRALLAYQQAKHARHPDFTEGWRALRMMIQAETEQTPDGYELAATWSDLARRYFGRGGARSIDDVVTVAATPD